MVILLKFDKIGDAIHENFQNASCTPTQFFVEENLDSWHPKTQNKVKTSFPRMG